MSTCKSVCLQYKEDKSYGEGRVFCRHCNLFMKYDGRYCPCCACLVRHSCRYTKGKNKIYEM